MPKVLRARKPKSEEESASGEAPSVESSSPPPTPDPRPEVNHPIYRRYSLGIFGKKQNG
jgi:hypothetical protein